MTTTKYTFIDIFNSCFDTEDESFQLKKITIPIIQRDYAQGRKDDDIRRVRSRFLDSLYKAVTEKPITLDFIYGDVDSNGIMTPLDGQQRLTTLFLLHWYAAKKESIAKDEYTFLKNFSYETRYSARNFCSYLIDFTPVFCEKISDDIINQAWFPLDWEQDPTISSMLVMLDAISDVFKDVEDLWTRLKEGAISFYFLPIKDMGLTDELYIKMNSRGKPLTQFEHFKAELERELNLVDKDLSKRLLSKIDSKWTQLLWQYRGKDNIIDDEFLKYFKYVCDIICYHNGSTPQGKSKDEFDLLEEYFSAQCGNAKENAETLEKYFDCWSNLKDESPKTFLERFISQEHNPHKIKIENRYDIDVFNDCLRNYADSTGRRRIFPLNRIVLLYAITSYLLYKDVNNISEEQFSRRLRIVNNLILNSEDEISDSENRSSGNRMPAILKQVTNIIKFGHIDSTIERNFNPAQIAEEIEKIKFIKENPDKAEALFALEDHNLLHGQIGIVGLKNYECFSRFSSLFNCDWDKVDCALMSIGFYGQTEKNGWRHQLGTASERTVTAWRNLFHKSSNNGYNTTHDVLIQLLSLSEEISNSSLDAIVDSYIKLCEENCEFDWRYYYIKYPIFRPSSFGKYYNSSIEKTPYIHLVMTTEQYISENSYMPFLKEADATHLSRDHMGQRLIYNKAYIECKNAAFVVKNIENEAVVETINISQNDAGVDTENRIERLKEYLSSKPETVFPN